MIRPLAFFWALWRFIAKTWADRNRHDPRGQEVDCPTTDYARATVAPNSDQEVDCPITDYTKEIESNPNDVTAYLARGTAHLKAFAYDRAIADFTKAIELKPNNDSAYTKRGSAHYERAEYDRAISDFTKALKINSRSALAHSNLGWTYEAIGDEKRAIAHYRMALEIDPSLEAPRDNLKLLGATAEHRFFCGVFPSNRFRRPAALNS
jgi:tetratricopeptide (TPR) repeat protein